MKRALATPPPACTCGAAQGKRPGHVVSCPWAQHALTMVGGRRAGGRVDGLGRSSRHGTAIRTERRGVRFASRLEAEVFEALWARCERIPGATIQRQPCFDLWRSWAPGMGRPLTFKPDFLLLLPRHVARALEPEEVSDDVRGREGLAWVERSLDLWAVEVHEAKTRKGLESRDYRRGLAAFRAEHPTWAYFEWRRPEGRRDGTSCERLADLVA